MAGRQQPTSRERRQWPGGRWQSPLLEDDDGQRNNVLHGLRQCEEMEGRRRGRAVRDSGEMAGVAESSSLVLVN